MAYQTREKGGYSIVELSGEVDLSCSSEARKIILEQLDADRNLLVDLSQVSYIDSSGIASLVEGFQTAKKKSLNFGLIAVSDAALSVLQLARLDKVFPIHDTLDARLQAD